MTKGCLASKETEIVLLWFCGAKWVKTVVLAVPGVLEEDRFLRKKFPVLRKNSEVLGWYSHIQDCQTFSAVVPVLKSMQNVDSHCCLYEKFNIYVQVYCKWGHFIYNLSRQAWDLALDLCLSQLPGILEENKPFQHSPFFAEQLTAFQVWLSNGTERRTPPEQLPIVLQVSSRLWENIT